MAGAAVQGGLSWRVGRVAETAEEAPGIRSLTLDLPNWPGHQAGQHVDIRLTAEDGYQAVRSYSIASAPEEPRVVVTVERLNDGEVSPYLVDEVRPGDQIEVRGPIGGYFVWNPAQGGPLFLIGGGSGIVPLMAMIRHRLFVGRAVPVRLLYSVRSAESVIYRAELDRLDSERAIEVILTYTRSKPHGWTGYNRRIDRSLLEEVAPPRDDHPLIYVCGPTAMVETAASALVELRFDPTTIRTERFGPTGR